MAVLTDTTLRSHPWPEVYRVAEMLGLAIEVSRAGLKQWAALSVIVMGLRSIRADLQGPGLMGPGNGVGIWVRTKRP